MIPWGFQSVDVGFQEPQELGKKLPGLGKKMELWEVWRIESLCALPSTGVVG